MKAIDIVNRLAQIIPQHTNAFSESLTIDSITVVGTTATATTSSAHNLVNGQVVSIDGVDAPVEIDTGAFLRTGTTATFETLQDHDLTLSLRDIADGGKTITISGATEAEFNGTFALVKVHNRRKLSINVADSGPTTISGAPLVDNANGNIFNGVYAVSNVTATTFDYMIAQAYPLDAVVTNASAQVSIRIISVLDVQQYLTDAYTAQALDDDLLVVQLGDVVQSKKRNEQTDAGSTTLGEYSFTPTLIQQFAVYVVMNVTDDLTGATARDIVESEYVPAICKAVLRANFDTGFTYSQYRATLTGHGVLAYLDAGDKNKAIYVHELTFEQLVQLTKADMAAPVEDVAMRDVALTLSTSLGTTTLSADIDLDEEPL